MNSVKLVDSYRKGYGIMRGYQVKKVLQPINVSYKDRTYHIRKGDYCMDAPKEILAKWLYLVDMIDEGITRKIIRIDEMIEITEMIDKIWSA